MPTVLRALEGSSRAVDVATTAQGIAKEDRRFRVTQFVSLTVSLELTR